ncbi:hypothetical protein B0T20DRAFT_493740 [Sordaria brevicollis]|uniref:Uncharacterized protein n=1 Tax=Sordaria brevicollis TaxID=83679 RepID=A0AAE0UFM9_SORBR|nr:hypothetical protein B0T20DRAFT_493740 [Sordaria brevicollis]
MGDSLPDAPAPRQPQGDSTQPDPDPHPSRRQRPGPLDNNASTTSHDQLEAPHASTSPSDFDDDDISTASDASDDPRHCKIDLHGETGVVVWDDVDHGLQYTSGLKVQLHVDTSEQRALFFLRGHLSLKAGNPTNVQLFLIIYPEVIRSIEFEENVNPPVSALKDNTFTSLRFVMTQPPCFVGPRGRPLQPKETSQDLLSAMSALSLVRTLTIYLDMDMLSIPEARDQLALFPLIFSSTDTRNRPRTDEHLADLKRLYRGAGGQIINSDMTRAVSNDGPSGTVKDARVPDGKVESNPSPAHFAHFNRKRRHSGDPLPRYVDQEHINESGPSIDLASSSQTPAQPPTPLEQKRQRTSEPPSLETSQDLALAVHDLYKRHHELNDTLFKALQDVFPSVRKMVDENQHRIKEIHHQYTAILEPIVQRTAKLETRIKELNARLDSQSDCRYDAEEERSLFRRLEDLLSSRLDRAIAREFDKACDNLRGYNTNEAELEMAYRLEVQRETLQGEFLDKVRDEFIAAVAMDDVMNKMAKDVMERVTGWIKDANGPSQDRTSLRATHSHSPDPPPPPPTENSLFVAVQDIQATYCPSVMDVDSVEMIRVMEYLRDNPLSAVMYCASMPAARRALVKKWKAEAEEDFGRQKEPS